MIVKTEMHDLVIGDRFVDLLHRYGTLGDVISALDARLEALEPLREYVPVIREEYAGRIAGPDSSALILEMSDEEREAALQKIEADIEERRLDAVSKNTPVLDTGETISDAGLMTNG